MLLKNRLEKLKKQLKIFAIVFLSLLVFFILLFVVLSMWLFKPKTPVDASEFTDKLEGLGYQVEVCEEDVLRAYNQDFELFFYIFDNEDQADELYSIVKKDFENEKTNNDSYSSLPNSYQLKTRDYFYLVCNVENTLLIAEVPAEYSDEIKEIRNEIGY